MLLLPTRVFLTKAITKLQSHHVRDTWSRHMDSMTLETRSQEGIIHRDLALRNVLVFCLDPDAISQTSVKVIKHLCEPPSEGE